MPASWQQMPAAHLEKFCVMSELWVRGTIAQDAQGASPTCSMPDSAGLMHSSRQPYFTEYKINIMTAR